MSAIFDIPEVQALDARHHLVRIPDELDVPLTSRVQALIDTAEFRRLARISQLGLVSLVYPAANHTRFEHSLGVYRMALLYLKQLAHDERFADTVSRAEAEKLVAAALLHDVGHWPLCHPIEDIHLPDVPRHEAFASHYILDGEIANTLNGQWNIDPQDIVNVLSSKPADATGKILHSLLSGPIDVDKMDYLVRDSLHAGVPYGRNFDQQRLIGSLCLNQSGDGLAITDKGRTAAEMMVFARYVMFSEVYWHHAVRSATAMLQRAFYHCHGELDLDSLFGLTEQSMIEKLKQNGGNQAACDLLEGLFGPKRQLYKRLAQYSFFQEEPLYRRLAGRPYPWLVDCAREFASLLGKHLNAPVEPYEILFDAPPVEREVEFDVEIFFPKERCYRPLGEVSPVVKTLAQEQFDDYVKRVRIFVHPRLAESTKNLSHLTDLIDETLDRIE